VEEDIFSTVGGLELGGHDLAAAAGGDGVDHAGSSSGLGAGVPSAASLADLAPVDTPSRTLLVQNVSQEVSDEELRRLFAAHGDLRMLYTAAKACGLVIVGFFDLRAAVAATTALQGFLLAGRQLEVAYSAPKKGEVNQINQVGLTEG
jgi:RNA recognition motif-containing protein